MYSPSPKVMDLLLDAICVVDAEGNFVYVSAACERIFGYTRDELVGRSMLELIYPADLDATLKTAHEVMQGRQKNHFENRYVRKDGQLAHIMWSASWSEEEQLRVAVAHDITERKHTEAMQAAVYAISEAANRSEHLSALFQQIHRIIADLLPVSLFAIALRDGQDGELVFPYYVDQDGQDGEPERIETRRLCASVIEHAEPLLLTPDSLAEVRRRLLGDNPNPGNWLAVPLSSKEGSFGALVIHGSSELLRYNDKNKELLHFVSTQIASAIMRMQMQSRLQYLSHHDQLTGLPNRVLLYDRLEQALLRAQRTRTQIALLYLDLDKFKEVNDAFGHPVGDRLLQAVAERLKTCMRDADTVARIGGDEFLILLEQIQQAGHALTIAEKVRTTMNSPFEVDGLELEMIPSIGIALYPDHGEAQDALMQAADKAMYQAKRRGGNQSALAADPDTKN